MHSEAFFIYIPGLTFDGQTRKITPLLWDYSLQFKIQFLPEEKP